MIHYKDSSCKDPLKHQLHSVDTQHMILKSTTTDMKQVGRYPYNKRSRHTMKLINYLTFITLYSCLVCHTFCISPQQLNRNRQTYRNPPTWTVSSRVGKHVGTVETMSSSPKLANPISKSIERRSSRKINLPEFVYGDWVPIQRARKTLERIADQLTSHHKIEETLERKNESIDEDVENVEKDTSDRRSYNPTGNERRRTSGSRRLSQQPIRYSFVTNRQNNRRHFHDVGNVRHAAPAVERISAVNNVGRRNDKNYYFYHHASQPLPSQVTHKQRFEPSQIQEAGHSSHRPKQNKGWKSEINFVPQSPPTPSRSQQQQNSNGDHRRHRKLGGMFPQNNGGDNFESSSFRNPFRVSSFTQPPHHRRDHRNIGDGVYRNHLAQNEVKFQKQDVKETKSDIESSQVTRSQYSGSNVSKQTNFIRYGPKSTFHITQHFGNEDTTLDFVPHTVDDNAIHEIEAPYVTFANTQKPVIHIVAAPDLSKKKRMIDENQAIKLKVEVNDESMKKDERANIEAADTNLKSMIEKEMEDQKEDVFAIVIDKDNQIIHDAEDVAKILKKAEIRNNKIEFGRTYITPLRSKVPDNKKKIKLPFRSSISTVEQERLPPIFVAPIGVRAPSGYNNYEFALKQDRDEDKTTALPERQETTSTVSVTTSSTVSPPVVEDEDDDIKQQITQKNIIKLYRNSDLKVKHDIQMKLKDAIKRKKKRVLTKVVRRPISLNIWDDNRTTGENLEYGKSEDREYDNKDGSIEKKIPTLTTDSLVESRVNGDVKSDDVITVDYVKGTEKTTEEIEESVEKTTARKMIKVTTYKPDISFLFERNIAQENNIQVEANDVPQSVNESVTYKEAADNKNAEVTPTRAEITESTTPELIYFTTPIETTTKEASTTEIEFSTSTSAVKSAEPIVYDSKQDEDAKHPFDSLIPTRTQIVEKTMDMSPPIQSNVYVPPSHFKFMFNKPNGKQHEKVKHLQSTSFGHRIRTKKRPLFWAQGYNNNRLTPTQNIVAKPDLPTEKIEFESEDRSPDESRNKLRPFFDILFESKKKKKMKLKKKRRINGGRVPLQQEQESDDTTTTNPFTIDAEIFEIYPNKKARQEMDTVTDTNDESVDTTFTDKREPPPQAILVSRKDIRKKPKRIEFEKVQKNYVAIPKFTRTRPTKDNYVPQEKKDKENFISQESQRVVDVWNGNSLLPENLKSESAKERLSEYRKHFDFTTENASFFNESDFQVDTVINEHGRHKIMANEPTSVKEEEKNDEWEPISYTDINREKEDEMDSKSVHDDTKLYDDIIFVEDTREPIVKEFKVGVELNSPLEKKQDEMLENDMNREADGVKEDMEEKTTTHKIVEEVNDDTIESTTHSAHEMDESTSSTTDGQRIETHGNENLEVIHLNTQETGSDWSPHSVSPDTDATQKMTRLDGPSHESTTSTQKTLTMQETSKDDSSTVEIISTSTEPSVKQDVSTAEEHSSPTNEREVSTFAIEMKTTTSVPTTSSTTKLVEITDDVSDTTAHVETTSADSQKDRETSESTFHESVLDMHSNKIESGSKNDVPLSNILSATKKETKSIEPDLSEAELENAVKRREEALKNHRSPFQRNKEMKNGDGSDGPTTYRPARFFVPTPPSKKLALKKKLIRKQKRKRKISDFKEEVKSKEEIVTKPEMNKMESPKVHRKLYSNTRRKNKLAGSLQTSTVTTTTASEPVTKQSQEPKLTVAIDANNVRHLFATSTGDPNHAQVIKSMANSESVKTEMTSSSRKVVSVNHSSSEKADQKTMKKENKRVGRKKSLIPIGSNPNLFKSWGGGSLSQSEFERSILGVSTATEVSIKSRICTQGRCYDASDVSKQLVR